MRVKEGLIVAAATLLMTSGYALAQQSTPRAPAPSAAAPSASMDQQMVEIKDNNAKASSLNINRKDLASSSIYGSDGKKIAGVSKVLGDSSGNIKAVTADVGGFLGMGSKEVVFPVDKLAKGKDKDHLTTTMTKDDIQKLPQYAAANNRSGSVGSSGSAPANRPAADAPRSTSPSRP